MRSNGAVVVVVAVDVVVVMLHGPYGEDGTIQGLLELAGVPYTGAGVLASAVGMDKVTMKTIFRAHGLPIVDHVVVERHEWRRDPAAVTRRIAETIGFPCFVKPSNLGSSVGISKAATAAALPAALDEAARHDRRIVVEHAVRAREIEVSVLGNDDPIASQPCEIVYDSEWYDYETKYAEGQARLVIPASVSTRTRSMSMLVRVRPPSIGVAPSLTIGRLSTIVSTRVIFIRSLRRTRSGSVPCRSGSRSSGESCRR